MKGDTAAPAAQTFVFFDIESSSSALAAQFAASELVNGSNPGVSKGSGYNGGLWQAVSVARLVLGSAFLSFSHF